MLVLQDVEEEKVGFEFPKIPDENTGNTVARRRRRWKIRVFRTAEIAVRMKDLGIFLQKISLRRAYFPL